MEKDSYDSFLPMNLFDDDTVEQSFQKDNSLIEQYDRSIDDARTRSSIDHLPFMQGNIKYSSSQKFTRDLLINKDCHDTRLITTKKKYSEHLPKKAFDPQSYLSLITPSPSIAVYPQSYNPNNLFFKSNNCFGLINQKAKTIPSSRYSIYNPIFNSFKPPNQRKAFTTKENYVNVFNNSPHIQCEEMCIKQILTNKGLIEFIDLIKTSRGSRIIQNKLNDSTEEDINIILVFLVNYFTEIMCDYYANYFFKRMIEYCNFKQRIGIFRNIQSDFEVIANNPCGTHCIQKLIVLHNSIEEEEVIKQIIEKVIPNLAYGDNSTHVIQKLIIAIPEQRREYINTFIIANLIELCLSSNGICIIKEFINSNQSIPISEILLSRFEIEANKLTNDQYGNFAIQEVIQRYGYLRCFKIIKQLKNQLVCFSSMKYSSNVIDFLLKYSHTKAIEVFNEIVTKLFFNKTIFNEMTKNKYGNYVLENAILLLDHDTLFRLKKIMLVNSILPSVKDKNKEKKIFKLIRNIKEC